MYLGVKEDLCNVQLPAPQRGLWQKQCEGKRGKGTVRIALVD